MLLLRVKGHGFDHWFLISESQTLELVFVNLSTEHAASSSYDYLT